MSLVTIALAVTLASVSVATAEDRDEFVGTWTLDAIEVRNEAGDWLPGASRFGGPGASGYLIYDAAGNMAVQIMRRDRRRLGPEGWQPGNNVEDWEDIPAGGVKDAFVGYVAYFGTYEVNEAEGYVVHRRTGNIIPDMVGTEVKRFYVLEGDTLTLMPNETSRLRWKRLPQDPKSTDAQRTAN